jgi:hypothetical protein
MFDAGSIVAKLGLDTAPFAAGISKATALIGGIGAGLAAFGAAAGAFDKVRDAMDRMDSAGKASDALGMTTEALVGLEWAAKQAGVGPEELRQSMVRMNSALADAVNMGGPASDALRRLGFDAESLANMDASEAFGKISDGLNSVQNAAERTALTQDIFGKQAGMSLAPLLQAGSAGLEQMQAEAEKLGLTFSRIDAAKVEQANDAMSRMSAVVEGVAQDVAVALAPYIEGVSDLFTDAATAGGGFGKYASDAVESVAKGVAWCADLLSAFEAGWHMLKAGALAATSGILYGLDLLGRGVANVLNLIPGVNLDWSDSFKVMADSVLADAKEETDKWFQASQDFWDGKNQQKVTAFFDSIKAKSEAAAEATAAAGSKMHGTFKGVESGASGVDKVADAMADLRKEVDTFGVSDIDLKLIDFKALTKDEKKIDDYKKLLDDLSTKRINQHTVDLNFSASISGLSDVEQQIAKFRHDNKRITDAQADEMRKALHQEDLGKRARQMSESLETPMQQYQKQIDGIHEMLAEGMVSKDLAARGTQKAFDDLFSATKPTQSPQLMYGNSAEEVLAKYTASQGNEELWKKQLQQLVEQTALLGTISRNMGRGGGQLSVYSFSGS